MEDYPDWRNETLKYEMNNNIEQNTNLKGEGKTMKKLISLILALMMITAVAAAWADADNTYEGSNNALATGVAGNTAIPLNKTVVIFNTQDNTTVREPDITFSYAITKVNSSASEGAQLTSTVSDGTNTAKVYNGVLTGDYAGAITNPANIVYSSTSSGNANTVLATTKGFEDEKSTNITVDPTKFPHAGIYRYVITESSNETLTNVGMEAHTSNYDNTRYLDVYIYNPDNDHNTLWMGAAVIFKSASTDESNPPKTASEAITTTTDKTTGFEPGNNTPDGSTNDYTDDDTVDRYFTYNLQVTKAITGTLADKNHDFPFQISFTGALANAVTVDVTNSSASPANTTLSISTTAATDTAALRDGETYSVTGLPKGTTVTVKEYNDTVDDYKLTTSFAGTTSEATISAATLGTDADHLTGETGVLINSGSTTVKADANTVLTFTNDLASISPTGYVSRFAPYALILIGGIALLIIAKKHKKHTDEE